MELKELIAECSAYDYKEILEEKKPRSWLKSVSAFSNGIGGSLFFGVNDDGEIVGMKDAQYAAEKISEQIREKMDPIPDVRLIPLRQDGCDVLQLKVLEGHYTPYYYVGDGQRVAFIRIGNESVAATAEQMFRLVLKGSGKTYDSIVTDIPAEEHSFTILANTFRKRTQQQWDKKYIKSFGLVTPDGYLTNAGALFADDCPLPQSRLYCTRWTGVGKDDAINDAEFTGNILMLLQQALNFVKSNTRNGWEKLPGGKKNSHEYAERAVLEGLVNHFIHRDYTVMGSEVHLDIYDDRLTITSPGGMYSGQQIQDLDIFEVSSDRRNPVLADVMAQLDYMEKRGSGLRRICNATRELDGYTESCSPRFKSTTSNFMTILTSVAQTDIPVESDKIKDKIKDKINPSQLTEIQSDVYKALVALSLRIDKINISHLTKKTGLSYTSVQRALTYLKKEGYVTRNGGNRNCTWKPTID